MKRYRIMKIKEIIQNQVIETQEELGYKRTDAGESSL